MKIGMASVLGFIVVVDVCTYSRKERVLGMNVNNEWTSKKSVMML